MAVVVFGGLPFKADLVVFDKDGTLIDFDYMWSRIMIAWAHHLDLGESESSLSGELFLALGFDPTAGGRQTDPEGPLAIATTGQMQAIAAGILYRRGVPWPAALDRAQSAYRRAAGDLPLPGLVRAAGDVAGLMRRLKAEDARLAVVTTDHRAETEESMRLLGVADLVDVLVCGDDGVVSKPAPDMLLAACRAVDVEPARAAVVGDTVADLLMGRRAGAGLRAGVLTGAGSRESLEPLADVVLNSIDDIAVLDRR